MWTSPLTSRESAGLKLEEGPHSREHSSRVVGTQDAIAVAEGTKHRDVYRYKDYECHYCRKKRAPCIRVLQEKEGLISATQTNHQVVAESSNEEEYVMYRIWQQSNETTHCGCQTEWNHDSCGSRHRCIRLHYE